MAPYEILREGRLLPEAVGLAFRFPSLLGEPRGRGETVLVLPGYGTGDALLGPLRSYLSRLDYRPQPWGLGRNMGNVARLLPQVIERAETCAEAAGRKIILLGWSLGGVLAREVARDRPELAARVVTLGTPVFGGPKFTILARRYRRQGYDLDAIAAQVQEREEVPIEVPITALYSRRDGVVAWRACRDHYSPRVEHLEVRSSHFGLILSAGVYRVLARVLGSPPGT